MEKTAQVNFMLKEWEEARIKQALKTLEETPNFANWENYFSIIPQVKEMERLFRTVILSQGNRTTKEDAEYEKIYSMQSAIADKNRKKELYKTGCRIFDITRKELERGIDAQTDDFIEFLRQMLEKLMVTEMIFEYAVPRQGMELTEEFVDMLIKKARVKKYLLEAKVEVNGQAKLLFRENRGGRENELEELEKKIKIIKSLLECKLNESI